MNQPTEIHALAGAYALDALTEIERASFARHVAECEACATEVAELTETASRLSVSAWELPPPRMRDAVLEEVSRTRQVTAGHAHRVERAAQHDVRLWRRRTAAAVAAGVVALGGIGTVWVVQENRVSEASKQAQQLQDAQNRMSQIIAAGDAQFRSVSVPGGGTMTVAISRQLDDGVVLMNRLPTPPSGKVYQLWLIAGTSPTSIGVMADGQTSGSALVDTIGNADSVGVTLEPSGGSATPTLSATVTGVTF
jgi:anti-sigma-K factor RskA